VIDGQELPEEWLGKPWACWQGARAADGDFLLFTDADTTHGPQMLSRAVAGLHEDDADLMTVLGQQLMGSFWERLVQPQVFMLMLFRFPDFERAVKNECWRDAIANGQYILFPRGAYDEIGGHDSVRGEVVEDMALAMLVKREGKRLRIRSAAGDLQTRMYRSLAELIEGWSKNIVMGVWLSVPPVFRTVVTPILWAVGVALWIVPPVVLLAGSVGWVVGWVFSWSVLVYALSVMSWAQFTRMMGGPARYGFLYPLGAFVGAYIFLRSWKRGRKVEWKGRRYTVQAPSEMP
jgi:chlorobactene glucosyltransferase